MNRIYDTGKHYRCPLACLPSLAALHFINCSRYYYYCKSAIYKTYCESSPAMDLSVLLEKSKSDSLIVASSLNIKSRNKSLIFENSGLSEEIADQQLVCSSTNTAREWENIFSLTFGRNIFSLTFGRTPSSKTNLWKFSALYSSYGVSRWQSCHKIKPLVEIMDERVISC